jgi:diphosphomevalonate decarboxylase
LYGGFVKWNKGTRDDGADSIAEQVVDESYWPEVEILVFVVSDQKKDTSSTSGMQTSVETSELLKVRLILASVRRAAL